MSTNPKRNGLDADRMVADLDRGIVRDRAEDWLPDELFGPPTAAERGASRNGPAATKAETERNGRRAAGTPKQPAARSRRAN